MQKGKSYFILILIAAAACVTALVMGKSMPPVLPAQAPAISPFIINQSQAAHLLGWVPANANDCRDCDGYFQQPASLQTAIDLPPYRDAETHFSATGPTYYLNQGLVITKDNVVITQTGRIAEADQADIYRNNQTGKIDQIILIGHVKLMQHNEILTASYATIDYRTNTVRVIHGVFHQEQPAEDTKNLWGLGKVITRSSDQAYSLTDATVSLCPPGHAFWRLSAKKIHINSQHDKVSAHHAIIRIKQLPVFYTPYISFGLSSQRKSGFLTPSMGHSTANGDEWSLPYYFNLAPNYDDLFEPKRMSRHGWQLNDTFRFLTPRSKGDLYLSFLPSDQSFDDFKTTMSGEYPDQTTDINELNGMSSTRGYVYASNDVTWNEHWSSDMQINYASDPYYFNDFESSYGTLVSNQLLNEGSVTYRGDQWTAATIVQGYQTLHLITDGSSVENQYQRLPETDVLGVTPDIAFGVNANWQAQWVNFAYNSVYEPETYQEPIGQRVYLAPALDRPFVASYGYVDPKVTLNTTAYSTELASTTAATQRPTFSKARVMPVIDVDSGLYFDRDSHLGSKTYRQTIEPRLFYLFTPYQDQSEYPVFDTSILPFSSSSLFSTNAFTGYDRLQNANQLSIGLTSRWLDQTTLAEKLSWDIGVIDYWTPQRVCLDEDCSGLAHGSSPLVTDLMFYPLPNVSTSVSGAWDFDAHDVDNASIATHYQSLGGGVFNLGYSYLGANTASNSADSAISYLTVGAGVPLGQRWMALGYWYDNLADGQLQSTFAGIQYSTHCWAARVTANKYYNYSTNEYNTGYFFEVLLKGLGTVGSSASSMIVSGIPGFQDMFKQ